MNLHVVDMKFQSELKWKPIQGLELSALGAVKYQTTSQEHFITDNSNQAQAYRAMGDATIRDKIHSSTPIRTIRMPCRYPFSRKVVFIRRLIIKW